MPNVKPAPGDENVLRARDPRGRALRWGTVTAEVRAAEGSTGRTFKGEAIVFNSPTWIGSKRWGYRETIAPEAVTRTLAEGADVRFVINHDPSLLLGRSTSGTLRLTPTDQALEVEADLPDVSYARDLETLLQRGDISQMSFAFTPTEWVEREGADGTTEVTITELDLHDVSVVTFPAYEDTSAGLRAEAFAVLCRSVGLDADGERQLLRDLTGAPDPDLDEPIVERVAEITSEPVASGDETPDEPAGEPDVESRDGGNPDGDTTNPDPGDRLRDLRAADLARALR